MAKNKKFDFKKVAMHTLIAGGTGAVAQVVAEAIDLKDPSYIDYGLIAAGAILPEVVKAPEMETAATALLAVGAYRMAERFDVAGKLGFNSKPATAGLYGNETVIGSGNWVPKPRTVYARRPEQSDEKKNLTLK